MDLEKEITNIIYKKRSSRSQSPDGSTDKADRWYPSEWEHCDCCDLIRQPTRRWNWSLLKHCSTKKHIKNLVEKHGIGHPDIVKISVGKVINKVKGE